MNIKFFQIFILLTISVLAPQDMYAAILYLSPSESTHSAGDTFIQEIRINTEGEFINTAEIEISYPADLLDIADFSNGNSVFSLWIQNPTAKNGVIGFIGGTPAGYQGSDGLLAKIIFSVKTPAIKNGLSGDGPLFDLIKFSDTSKILLNDGFATLASVKLQNANISIIPKLKAKSENKWRDEVALDAISPEPFMIQISSDKNVFGGKHFISFSTVDKQTGIDHYEVFEYLDGKVSENKDAKSPYLLENQNLNGIIRVRAVDKRGNEAISEIRLNNALQTKDKNRSYETYTLVLIAAFFLALASCIIFYAKTRRKISQI